jgi:CrcB protein
MQVETVHMLQAHAHRLAAGYVLASIAAGLAAVHLASAVARRVRIGSRP